MILISVRLNSSVFWVLPMHWRVIRVSAGPIHSGMGDIRSSGWGGERSISICPRRVSFSPTRVSLSETRVSFIPTGVSLSFTPVKLSPTGVNFSPTGVNFSSTPVKLSPTRVSLSPTDGSLPHILFRKVCMGAGGVVARVISGGKCGYEEWASVEVVIVLV